MQDMVKSILDIQPKKAELEELLKNYSFQKELTEILDSFNGDIDQNILNLIVLWKTNRFVIYNPAAFDLVNQIKQTDHNLNEELTKKILSTLLSTDLKGVRLAMASTILRFKNPHVYQIIDQRVYRIIYSKELKIPGSIPKQIDIYIQYLKKLRELCNEYKIAFSQADRILYELDKKHNKEIKINY